MSTWQPASRADVEAIVIDHLRDCTDAQRTRFDQIRVPLRPFQIDRLGSREQVYVVAQLDEAVVFWDDVEEGFEITVPDEDGVLRDFGASQFDLSHVMYQVQNGRS